MVNFKKQAHCRKCNQLSSDLDKEGICPECRRENSLMVNNPNGYNKAKKNPNPKPVVPEIMKHVTKEEVQEAYIELWKAKSLVLSKAHKYNELFKRFMDIERLEEKARKEEKLLSGDSIR